MKRRHAGSNLEDFLADDGILEDCRASAIKFEIARELERAMEERHISKAEMARRLKTSRTGIERLLDPENTSITLNTMAKVARLLGRRIGGGPPPLIQLTTAIPPGPSPLMLTISPLALNTTRRIRYSPYPAETRALLPSYQ